VYRKLGIDLDVDIPLACTPCSLIGVLSALLALSSTWGRCRIDELVIMGDPVPSTVTTLVDRDDRPCGADDL